MLGKAWECLMAILQEILGCYATEIIFSSGSVVEEMSILLFASAYFSKGHREALLSLWSAGRFTQMPINHFTVETDTSIISQQLRNRQSSEQG